MSQPILVNDILEIRFQFMLGFDRDSAVQEYLRDFKRHHLFLCLPEYDVLLVQMEVHDLITVFNPCLADVHKAGTHPVLL